MSLAVAAGMIAVAIAPASQAQSRCETRTTPERLAQISAVAPSLDRNVLRLALEAAACAEQRDLVKRRDILTVIDYSLPSTEKRLWVFDLSTPELLFHEHVSHGVNSGQNRTTSFSNVEGSRQTSLGLFTTAETYMGSNGYSLRLSGHDRGFNDQARKRAIVIHGAPYVNPEAAKRQGRLGRSWGCPAVRTQVARSMIDTIKGGSPVFAFYPDQRWITSSRFLAHQRDVTRIAELSAK